MAAATRFLKHDVPASLVVFLIAVPLSLGIAVASGAPVIAGLIAAVIGGIVAGALGGSPLQVSGPAAGLTVVVADLINRFGWQATCAITLAAGLLQILLGLSRTARAALAISPSVVHGMLAGIGLTIVFSQLHVVLGGTAGSSFVDNLTELPGQIANLHGDATLLGLGVIAVLLLWPLLPKKVRVVPGPLVAIAGATLIAVLAGSDAPRVDLPGSILSSLTAPVLPTGDLGALIVAILTITLIASVESLASAVAVDGMHTGKRANLNRELIGQGAANTVSGAIGGLPITGVIVRSSTNVTAGAKTRASAILHGVWVLLFSSLLFSVVELIPLAALAGLLVHVGAKLVNLGQIKRLHRHGESLVYAVTVVAVVLLNLLEGVLIGLALSLLLVVYRVVIASIRAQQADDNTWRLAVHGKLSFLSIPRLAHELGRIPANSHVVVELITEYLDHAAYEYLHGWVTRHEAAGGTVLVDEIGQAGLESSLQRGREARTRHLPRWFTPWSHWQRIEHPEEQRAGTAEHSRSLDVVLNGIREYQIRSRELMRPHMAKLAEGQRPRAMWIGCGDSRVVPNVLTSSGPGDLFTVRNIGNVVPARDSGTDASVAASLEFAVGVLEVPVLVVCGHSGCGAMQVLSTGRPADGPLGDWLATAAPTVARWRDGDPIAKAAAEDGFGELDQLAMINVAEGLRNLHTHAVVADAVATGKLQLVGMFLDIPSGRLLTMDEETRRFVPVSEGPTIPVQAQAERVVPEGATSG
ncbi:SulP family inorganic anion transporter [Sciscionella marina]|uniref:SulP family inorganic anion transporter n=1 Tax=Sciscionella marina TaxID=508770 RepID=UPI00037B326D|nr:bifunctional SulP family inorganic anion transporter/carbonic anhydrase [Sciscionella marina]